MPNYFLNTGTNSWVERPAAGYLPQRYAVTELPAFEMGLAMDIGTIIGHAFVDLVPLEMGLAMPSGSVNQSAALPEFSLGLSMDIGDAFLVRYVSLPSLDMGILPAFGDVLQVAALPSMDMGLEIDGPAIVVSVPLPNIDMGISAGFGEASSFETGSAIIRYFCILTGAADGTTDLTLPMKSFQARRRSGDPTYLSVVIPTVDYASEIAARPNGTLKIQQAYEQNGVIKQTETIMETDLEEVSPDEGGTNQSTTLTGYSTSSFSAKSVSLRGVTYRTISSGKYRYRLARPYIFLNPGDTVTVLDDGVEFTIATMSYFIDAMTSTIELEST
jgi:hypothetical protein